MTQKGIDGATDYAKKRKDQIENSKKLREERKQGTSLLKNAGDFMLKTQNGQGQSRPDATSTSGFSHMNGAGGLQTASTSISGGFSGFQKYNQEAPGVSTSQYGRGFPASNNLSNISGKGVQSTGNFASNQFMGAQGNAGRQQMGPQTNLYDDPPLGNQMRTQENYYNPQSNRQRNMQQVAQSISYDSYNNPQGINQPQNYTMQGFNQGAQASYTSSSGFNRQPGNNGMQPPLSLHSNSQFKSERQPSYSREDLMAARSNLQLLKKRMGSKQPMNRDRAQSYNNNDDDGTYDQNQNSNSNLGRAPRGNSQYGNIPKPNNTSRPTSGLSHNNPDNTGYQNRNFRKAFNPGDNDSQGNSIQRSESYENLDNLSNNGINLPNDQNRFGGVGVNSQKKIPQKISEYDPTQRSNNQPARKINQNQILQQNTYEKQSYSKQQTQKQSYNNKYQDEEEEEDDEEADTYNNRGGQGNSKSNNANKGLDKFSQEQPDEYPQDEGERIECPTCGRKFVEQALVKHAKVCKKVFVQKRKVFDIKKQRQIEDEAKDDYGSYKPPTKKQNNQQSKKPLAQEDQPIKQSKAAKWKAQSEMFRQAMRATKGNDTAGGDSCNVQQPQAQQYDDRTECQFCNRKFNDEAAKRHIPSCEQKFKANQMKSKAAAPQQSKQQRTTSIGFRKK
ncbi:UNKNOWN [Stylonychia lemnae]|uniref:C2HC/C3H-type domain-containing protein n=1 Tax=Stylonychia lemnae TaxID=5949 RepID=A0A078A7B3_STYLE|nr:UNKNOWN [Stylonychia lemnae]|eukprot:CDW78140.1 UNKNOWN [Stylonychia lemnae]